MRERPVRFGPRAKLLPRVRTELQDFLVVPSLWRRRVAVSRIGLTLALGEGRLRGKVGQEAPSSKKQAAGMVARTASWLAILVSGMVVFIASAIMHLVTPYHRGDYK